jgi:transcriptional regulator with XRE-family HTH domain
MGGESVAKARYDEWLTEDGLMKIEAWAREGLTEEQIAMKMGVSVRTLGNWKQAHMPILQALKKGKAPVDAKVENALLRRALGYQYEEITEAPVMNPETGETKMEIVKRVTKHVPPDTTAQIYWLKNRRPDKWRDKPADPNGASEDDSKTIRVVFDPLPEDDNDGH